MTQKALSDRLMDLCSQHAEQIAEQLASIHHQKLSHIFI